MNSLYQKVFVRLMSICFVVFILSCSSPNGSKSTLDPISKGFVGVMTVGDLGTLTDLFYDENGRFPASLDELIDWSDNSGFSKFDYLLEKIQRLELLNQGDVVTVKYIFDRESSGPLDPSSVSLEYSLDDAILEGSPEYTFSRSHIRL